MLIAEFAQINRRYRGGYDLIIGSELYGEWLNNMTNVLQSA